VLPVIALLAIPVDRAALQADPAAPAIFDPVVARGVHMVPGEARTYSKKEEWLRDKELRPDFHLSDADLTKAMKKPGGKATAARGRIEPVTTLYNIWTHEALPILPGQPVEGRFHTFLRDHFTNQATHMDTRLVDVLERVAHRFSAKRIEVVSGYRSPKYNLMLRKKGHQVARHSQHMEGNAVDFRIRGVETRQVLHFVRSLRVGGVGYYPHSQFVHSDTGRIRYWTGS
jgi:hypothetical protein